MKISMIETCLKTDAIKHVEFAKVLDGIKKGRWKNLVDVYRSTHDKKALAEFKKTKMPAVLFSGIFADGRNDQSIIEHSGMCVLDFDSLPSFEAAKEFRNEIFQHDWVIAAFVSPSGRGVKAVVKIPSDVESHSGHYSALIRELQEGGYDIDTTSRNISRLCFVSYDEGLLYREDATIYSNWLEVETKEQPLPPQTWRVAESTNKDVLDICINMIKGSVDGAKHNVLLRASKLAGGYISGGHIKEQDAISALEFAISNKDVKDLRAAKKTITDGIKFGKQYPIFDYSNKINDEEEKKYYYTLFDVKNDLKDYRYHKPVKGVDTGLKPIDEIFSMLKGTTTYAFGSPHSGKTEIFLDIALYVAEKHNWKFALYMPENGDVKDLMAELCKKYIMRPYFVEEQNHMTDEQAERAEKFIDEHFLIFDANEYSLSIEGFLTKIKEAEDFYGCKIDCIIADPFNEFDHSKMKDDGNRQDLYIENMLGKIRRDAKKNNRHNIFITHSNDNQEMKTVNGINFMPMPHARDVAGGKAWFRKAMQLVAIWRPPQTEYKPMTVGAHNELIFKVLKSKPKGVGKLGEASVFWDYKRQRYYYKDLMGNILFGGGKPLAKVDEERGLQSGNPDEYKYNSTSVKTEKAPF
jgi:hypothetical protein